MNIMKEKLSKSGYKLTGQRLAILEYFSKKHKPISALSLCSMLKNVDRASVYRSLNLFVKIEILNIETINKESIYCATEKPHHHIVCNECGYIEKINCNHKFEHLTNFTNIKHQLTLSGICQNCIS